MRNHIRKTTRAQYSKEQMQVAVAAVLTSQLSVRESACINDVNYKTLGRYAKLQQLKGDIVHVGYKTIRQVFNGEVELLLVEYIKKAAVYHGLTPKNICELVKSNNLKMPTTWLEQQIAGFDWFSGFMHRI